MAAEAAARSCGICAGDRARVALGDVIMADQLYCHDDGKVVVTEGGAELLRSGRSFDLEATWKMDAAYLARELHLSALRAARPPSKAAQRRWLLHAIHAHDEPLVEQSHPAGRAPRDEDDRGRRGRRGLRGDDDRIDPFLKRVERVAVVREAQGALIIQHRAPRPFAFSPDGRTLASGSYDTTVRLSDVTTARVLRVFGGHTSRVMSIVFSPDGLTLASGSHGSDDNTVRLWDVATTRTLRAFEGHTNGVLNVAFSPDGLTLASGSHDGTIRLWSVATARCLAILLPCAEGWAAFTPDGRYKLGGDIAGSFWHVIGLCRFEPGELDPYLPHLRIPDDEPLIALVER